MSIGGLDLNRCSNVAEMLHLEVDSFVDWILPSPVEDEVRSTTYGFNFLCSILAAFLKSPFGYILTFNVECEPAIASPVHSFDIPPPTPSTPSISVVNRLDAASRTFVPRGRC
ncbi:hypothetical protein BYT27DRAFT_7261732 [Phlegmacium glaucopus]|nr:hypothetical protein BYT27DRAFT_7261732 [Phlegmacium glaucopus]